MGNLSPVPPLSTSGGLILGGVTSDQPAWRTQADQVGRVCASNLSVLAGVYVHGSAALGGFTPASDLDMLIVGDGATDWDRLGSDLLSQAPGFPLELSVVAPGDAAAPAPPWPFRLHVASPDRVVLHRGDGDPDLAAHYAVTRQSGIAIAGTEPRETIGPVPRNMLLTLLTGELEWGRTHADQRYTVLNACRAEAYAVDRRLVSKIDGAHWWTRHHGPDPVVEEALTAQTRGTDLGPCTRSAGEFIERVIQTMGVQDQSARPASSEE